MEINRTGKYRLVSLMERAADAHNEAVHAHKYYSIEMPYISFTTFSYLNQMTVYKNS